MSVEEVCNLAHEMNGLVIAAHIDEFNGINAMGHHNMLSLFSKGLLDAVQGVNKDLWEAYSLNKDKEKLCELLTERYGTVISPDLADSWCKAYEMAKAYGMAMTAFSDNPCAEGRSDHGLWGIGRRYSWIKMGSQVNLAALRLAFLAGTDKIRMDLDAGKEIHNAPDLWIRSVTLKNSRLNRRKPLHVEFNPQLNCIIGGRGSGKSSIIRILAGGLESVNQRTGRSEQREFYRLHEKKSGKGIFDKDTELEIEVCRYTDLYKLRILTVDSEGTQERELYKWDEAASSWMPVEDMLFMNFLKAQVYTQKEVFEIATGADSLMGIIDRDIDGLDEVEKSADHAYEKLLDRMKELRRRKELVVLEPRLRTELSDIASQIEKFKLSGISDLLEEKQDITRQEQKIGSYLRQLKDFAEDLKRSYERLTLPVMDEEEASLPLEVKEILHEGQAFAEGQVKALKEMIVAAEKNAEDLRSKIESSAWKAHKLSVEEDYKKATESLRADGIVVDRLDQLLQSERKRKDELESVLKAKAEIPALEKAIEEGYKEYEAARAKIRNLRSSFINAVLKPETNVKIELISFKGEESLGKMIRTITQKDGQYLNDDIDKMSNLVFRGDPKRTLPAFRKLLMEIREGTDQTEYSVYTKRAIRNLDPDLFDKMLAFLPDDQLRVSYRSSANASFKPISTASAGQKAAAILTFILSHGEMPLLLDQPEDDLDNKLVYELIVKRLGQVKDNRQIIVVTHNANIPVNGEAEYVITMNSESANVEVSCAGTMDHTDIVEEICNIMEGSEQAFKKRADRYRKMS